MKFTHLKNWIARHKYKVFAGTAIVLGIATTPIPGISALTVAHSILTEANVAANYVVGVPDTDSKFVELGTETGPAPTGVENSVKSMATIIGTTPHVIESPNGNFANKEKYNVEIQIACASGETGDTKIGENNQEVIIGTLKKPKDSKDYTFEYRAGADKGPSFVGTYGVDKLDHTDTNLWSYIRITNIKMSYFTEDGAEIKVINNKTYPTVQNKVSEMTNTIIGGTFIQNDTAGGYTMKNQIPSRLAFGIFYPKTLNFKGLNTSFLWGIDFFGFTCPKTITVMAFRTNGITNVLVKDDIIYERAEKPILFVLYSYHKSNNTDPVITDVMATLDNVAEYKYQLKFDYQTATEPLRFSSIHDIGKNDEQNSLYIFFSKNQFGRNTEIAH